MCKYTSILHLSGFFSVYFLQTELNVVSYNHKVMEIDGYETSHPVHQNVNLPAEIWGMFNDITYDKVK